MEFKRYRPEELLFKEDHKFISLIDDLFGLITMDSLKKGLTYLPRYAAGFGTLPELFFESKIYSDKTLVSS